MKSAGDVGGGRNNAVPAGQTRASSKRASGGTGLVSSTLALQSDDTIYAS